MTMDGTRFEDRLRAGLAAAAADLHAPDDLDGVTVDRRIARRRRRRTSERTAAVVVLVALVGGLVAVVDRSGGRSDRTLGAGPATPRTGEPGWARIADAPIAPRFEHTVVWTGTEAVVLGGYGAGGEAAGPSVAAYDPVAGTWRSAADLPGGGGGESVAEGVWTGDRLLVLGGDGALHAYDPATDVWDELAHSPWADAGTAITAAVWTGSELVVVNMADEHVDAAAAYDPASDAWRPLDAPPFESAFNQVAWTGSLVAVLGEARAASGRQAPGTLLALLDPATGAWTTRDDVPLAHVDRRGGTFMLWTGSELVLGGGAAQTDEGLALASELAATARDATPEEQETMALRPLGDVVAWDPATDTWRRLPDVDLPGAVFTQERWPTPWSGELALLLTTDPASADAPRPVLFAPAASTWTEVPPSAAGWHQDVPAVWTGEEFLVWSGEPTATDTDPSGCCVPTPLGETLTP